MTLSPILLALCLPPALAFQVLPDFQPSIWVEGHLPLPQIHLSSSILRLFFLAFLQMNSPSWPVPCQSAIFCVLSVGPSPDPAIHLIGYWSLTQWTPHGLTSFASSLYGVVIASPTNFISQLPFFLSPSLRNSFVSLFLIKANTINFIAVALPL